MLHRLTTVIAAITFFAISASAQTILQADETQTAIIPCAGSGAVEDHAVAAVNERGDILVVWDVEMDVECFDGSLYNNVNDVSQVAMMFIPTKNDSGTRKWKMPNACTKIGNACALGRTQVTHCIKPHVTAVGRNFVIVYPRKKINEEEARLEAIAVKVTPHATNPATEYATHTIYYENSNTREGHVVSDGHFTNGWYTVGTNSSKHSGFNAHVTHFNAAGSGLPSKNGAVAVFIDQPVDQTPGDYDLYAVYLNYDKNGIGSAPVEKNWDDGTNNYLVGDVTSDGDTDYGDQYNVAPHVIQDDGGALILAYDEWLDEAPVVGRIRLKSYTFDDTNNDLDLQDTWDRTGSDSTWHHRRPVMGHNSNDSDDHVGLGWTNYSDTSSSAAEKMDWRTIELDGSNDFVQVTDKGSPGTDRVHARPILAQGSSGLFEALLYRDESGANPEIKYWNGTTETRIDSGTAEAHRPAYDICKDTSNSCYYLIALFDKLNGSNKAKPYIWIGDI